MLHLLATPEPPRASIPGAEGGAGGGLDAVARYEFRIFGRDLSEARGALAELGEPAGEEHLRDIYILAEGRIEASLKLRGPDLDLKLWSQVTGRFELWCPADRAPLPLDGAAIRRRFLDPAGVSAALDPDAAYDARALRAALDAAPGIRTLALDKRRTRFDLGGALAEWTTVTGDAGAVETVAVEGTDPEELARLLDCLGIAGAANTSYPRHLHHEAFGTWA